MVDVSFLGKMGTIHSCREGNVASSGVTLSLKSYRALPPLPSILPAFLPPCSWDVSCLHSPASANTHPRQHTLSDALPAKQAVGQTHRGQLHVEAAQDQQRAAGQRLLISATRGIESHKSSAPARIVILPRVS